jgi:hypothetical protein
LGRAPGKVLIGKQLFECGGMRCNVIGGHNQSGLMFPDELSHSPHGSRDNGKTHDKILVKFG